jgi:phage portal protein BeeE
MLDLDNLMRLDIAALYESNDKGVNGGWLAPNEARFRANYRPVIGGASPMIQQQNYSLAALAKRDAKEDPFESKSPAPTATPEPKPPEPEKKSNPDEAREFGRFVANRRLAA